MVSDRMRRVDIAVGEVLSDALLQVKDPRVGFVTITGVDTAPNLRQARVFVSVLGTDSEKRQSLTGLESAHGFLQQALARELHLKHTPTLEFVVDETAEHAQRIEQLLRSEAPPEAREH